MTNITNRMIEMLNVLSVTQGSPQYSNQVLHIDITHLQNSVIPEDQAGLYLREGGGAKEGIALPPDLVKSFRPI